MSKLLKKILTTIYIHSNSNLLNVVLLNFAIVCYQQNEELCNRTSNLVHIKDLAQTRHLDKIKHLRKYCLNYILVELK